MTTTEPHLEITLSTHHSKCLALDDLQWISRRPWPSCIRSLALDDVNASRRRGDGRAFNLYAGRFRMTLDLHGSRRRWRRTVHSDDLTQPASRRDVTGLFPYSMNSRCRGGRGALFRRFTSTRIRNGLARRWRRRRRSPGFLIITRRTQNKIHGHGERRVVAHQYPLFSEAPGTGRDGKSPNKY